MEIITILLAIITALLLTPYIIKLVKLTKHKVKNYDSDIEECYQIGKDNRAKLISLEKTIQDLIILQGKETEKNGLNTSKVDKVAKDVYDFIVDAKEEQEKIIEKHNTLQIRFDAVADDVYNAIFMGTEFVREKLTPKSTKDASLDNYCKTKKGTLEDKDMFQPLDKFKKKRRDYEKTPFVKPNRETIESYMPVKFQRGKGTSKKAQEKNLNEVRKSAGYKKEYNKIYATIYAKRYYQYKKHIIK